MSAVVVALLFIALAFGYFQFVRGDAARSDPGDAFVLLLEGVIATLAVLQLSGANHVGSGGAIVIGVVMAVAVGTAAAFARSSLIQGTIEMVFSVIALIALIPTLGVAFGDLSCGHLINRTAFIAAVVVFTISFASVAVIGILRAQTWSAVLHIGMGWFGFVELLLFWSLPAAWQFTGQSLAPTAAAIIAAAVSGTLVAWYPRIAFTILGLLIAIGALIPVVTSVPTCADDSLAGTEVPLAMLAYAGVGYAISSFRLRRARRRWG